MELLTRFFDKVLFTSDCWEWQGAKNQSGYGLFWTNNKSTSAHRFSYELHNTIPDNLQIDHLCRNHSCVNPEHLEVVTQKENVLRGIGVTAKNKRKTHCPQGHPYSGKNLKMNKLGFRECRICSNLSVKKWKLKVGYK